MRIFLVNRQLAPLAESFGATIYPTNKRFLTGVSILVLLQILWQHESFLAMLAYVSLLISMFHVVSFERELAREQFLTSTDVALVDLFSHSYLMLIVNTS